MMELVDREKLLKDMGDRPKVNGSGLYALGAVNQYYCDRLAIETAPTVDAVPVVRCKDCIYPYICGVEMYCDHITGEEILVYPHEFCCWGVRKDGDNG